MKIDSHIHFWIYDPVKDAWIDDTMSVLKGDYLPEELVPLLDKRRVDGVVAVQADQSENETHYLLGLADHHDFIKGVVGWVDFRSSRVEERLEYFSQFPCLKGFRHIVQAEQQQDYLLRDDFCRGISLLRKFNFTYDILIYPKHLKYAVDFVKRFPDQKFVLDHLAKPDIKNGRFQDWRKDLQAFSELKHVSCKMAGLVTEADWLQWKPDDFGRYISVGLEIFGPDRIMFGSDWPVCTTAASYNQVCE
ncbi:MAG: amidohydrolase family protein, partial [Puia sp.]